MYILGIADSLHDRSACLLSGSNVISAIEEERLTRVKHGFSYNSQNYTLDRDGKHIAELLSTSLSYEKRSAAMRDCVNYCLEVGGIALKDVSDVYVSSIFEQPVYHGKKVPHHLAHAASAFYPAPFEEAAILVLDGAGDFCEKGYEIASLYFGNQNSISSLQRIYGSCEIKHARHALPTIIAVQHSIGSLYKNTSAILEMGVLGEGKTMGLASYGRESSLLSPLDQWVHISSQGELSIDNYEIYHFLLDYKNRWIDRANSSEEKFELAANLARKVQLITETCVVGLARRLYQLTRSKSICLAGGVALNSVANYRILEETPFENIFIQPAAGDNGLSIGAAYWGLYSSKNQMRACNSCLFNPYLGKTYSEAEILQAYAAFKEELHCKKLDEKTFFSKVALILSNGMIIGWFQDGSEIGPRALGNRSILADPRKGENKDFVNARVKHRESFRPFAPAILEENSNEFFEFEGLSPYMLLVPKVRPEKRALIPAVTHIDGTARLQTVSKFLNPKFHQLICEFHRLTGVPVLLNTSFNGNGQPIVETPLEALRFFASSDMDALLIQNLIVVKRSRRLCKILQAILI